MQSTIKKILVIITMVMVLGGLFTGILTYSNIGFTDVFVRQWALSFVQAVCVLFPMGVGVMWVINKMVEAFFSDFSAVHKNLIFGLGMAICMEAIMALSTTYSNIGIRDLALFSEAFLASYLMVLPVALILSPVMTLLIKPKLEVFLAR
jgi:hypothetical protein